MTVEISSAADALPLTIFSTGHTWLRRRNGVANYKPIRPLKRPCHGSFNIAESEIIQDSDNRFRRLRTAVN